MMSADSNVISEWGSTEEEIVANESSKEVSSSKSSSAVVDSAPPMYSFKDNTDDRDTPLDCNNGDIINSSPLMSSFEDNNTDCNTHSSDRIIVQHQASVDEEDGVSTENTNCNTPIGKVQEDLKAAETSNFTEAELRAIAEVKVREAEEEAKRDSMEQNNMESIMMELNVALEALESMRRCNLEVEFGGIMPVQHDRCTYCQREAVHKLKTSPPPPPKPTPSNEGAGITIGKVKLDGSRLRRFGSLLSKKVSTTASDNDVDKQSSSFTSSQGGNSTLSSMDSIGEDNDVSGSTVSNGGNNIRQRRNIMRKIHHPCLTCGHPTCSKHSSSALSKNHIPICQPCSYLFELDFLIDVITNTASNTEQCRQKVDEMVDCYDRAKLLLVYTTQYADEIATALEGQTSRSNKVGAGSSATGIVSGLTGVVGCGALLFPPVAAAGVPLLIASLVFGGGATAAQTGDAAVKHFSEPNRLAEKIVALHGMVLSLLRITEVLSCGLLKSQLNVAYSVEHLDNNMEKGGINDEWEKVDDDDEDEEYEESTQREELSKEIKALLEKHGLSTTLGVNAVKNVVTSGIVASEVAAATIVVAESTAAASSAVAVVAGAEAAAVSSSTIASGASVLGRSSRYFGRVGTTAANSLKFIPIAGGILSGVCVIYEGRELKRTLSRINEGNPCAMADQVREIKEELGLLPDSSLIAAECRRVFELAQKEKERKEASAALALAQSRREEKEEKDDILSFEKVDHMDISDIISVMDIKAKANAMQETDMLQQEESATPSKPTEETMHCA